MRSARILVIRFTGFLLILTAVVFLILGLQEPRHKPGAKALDNSQRPRNVTVEHRGPAHSNLSKMATDFNGKWVLVESENFDEYLQAVGVNFMLRQLAKAAKPKQEIQQNGDNFVVKNSGIQTKVTTFVIGEEFEDDSPIGKVKCVITWKDGKLHTEAQGPRGTIISEREIREDGRMYFKMTAPNGTSAVRIFAKE